MNALVALAVGVLGVAGLLGGALAILQSARAKTLIDLQRETITTLEKQKDAFEKELQEIRPRMAANEEKIALLTEMVTGAAKVDALASLVTARHEEVMAALHLSTTRHEELMGAVQRISDTLRAS